MQYLETTCSPISDTTILSSMGAGCNHIDQC
ncbi:Na+/H+ antiporter NhaC family protein [Clostridioides difficile]|nr:Na+/H+ antiporter NhaC family protein [Clostridioides difficile]UCA29474.1 Na+/H+ antiporter NhaC family protein [Clostridioides difficile]